MRWGVEVKWRVEVGSGGEVESGDVEVGWRVVGGVWR